MGVWEVDYLLRIRHLNHCPDQNYFMSHRQVETSISNRILGNSSLISISLPFLNMVKPIMMIVLFTLLDLDLVSGNEHYTKILI